MTQYFHVDESGEPGLHNPKSSPYYVLAMVQLPGREPIPELAELRKKLHVVPTFEFHFYQMSLVQKSAFFQAIAPLLFRLRVAVVLKTELPPLYRSLDGMGLTIELITALAMRASPLDIGDDILVIDGATDALRRNLRIRLSQECKYLNRVRPFKKIVTADSSRDDGLQLADMLAGAVREYIWNDDPTYQRSFSNNIVDMWHVK